VIDSRSGCLYPEASYRYAVSGEGIYNRLEKILKMQIKPRPLPLSQYDDFEVKVTGFRFRKFCKPFVSEIRMNDIAVYFRAVLICGPDLRTASFDAASLCVLFICIFIYSLSADNCRSLRLYNVEL
jgi:hypothetical protein